MPDLRIRLSDSTCRAVDSLAGTGGRAEFIRNAIKRAILEAEYDQVRAAYASQPDSETEADDWSNCEEYKA